MKTMRMTGMGTNDKRSYYILVKESAVEKPLNEIMEKIGCGILYYGKDEGDDFTQYENRVDHILSGKYDIDVIYTSDRIVLIVRAQKAQQEIFKNLIVAHSKFENE